jgi:isopenicillin-N epimerase
LWSLLAEGVFLNHGSFGACPIVVQHEQDRIRREYSDHPEEFFRKRVMPDSSDSDIRKAASELGSLIGTAGNNVAIVENATTGIQAVLQSVPLEPGDEVLITDHQYRAVKFAVEKRCRETGAIPRIVTIPIPAVGAEVIERISAAANAKVKLAIVDHITSATALVFPIREIVAELHRHDIPVLVDGAHAIGHVALDMHALQADWYVSNAHKWLFAPPGTAFLYASDAYAARTHCLVTSHFVDLGFPRAFDYVGTRDYGNWLTIPAAIAFHRQLDPESLKVHNAGLIRLASEKLAALGAVPVCELDMCANMRSFVLPQRRAAKADDALKLRDALWDEERIQIAAGVFSDRLLLRVSAQAYVDGEDIVRLGEALARRGWPGR